MSIWKPNVTVAAVIEHDGRYLLVEEETEHGLQFNQPAGHLEHRESLIAACRREVLEETARHFRPTALVGIYQWSPPGQDALTYLRFAFCGEAGDEEASRPLDDGIVRAVWLTYDEVLACRERHRSPLILQCIDDYRAGQRFPLTMVRHYD